MIDHLSSYTQRFDLARRFYLAALAPLGYPVAAEMLASWDEAFPTRRLCAFGPNGKAVFWLIEATVESTPGHVAFSAQSRQQVQAFYDAGRANGGQDNGSPGLRPMYHENYFGAFLLDPDGNNVEAVYHGAAKSEQTNEGDS